ncbi:MAG: adenylate/guanylate cyclase domain-containing protein [Gammaproteobacteria bacterium]|nr:adenylate/guanylate cyclase domain-containing protein [Gammaproteobacteria bacterium]
MEQGFFCIVFADVCGSSRLYATLGDDKAQECVQYCLEPAIALIREGGGTVIKTIGDEVMCRFDDADPAVDTALRIQEMLDRLPPMHGAVLRMRIGLHAGPAILKDNDVFGDAVNIAARMAGIARAEQIITTADTVARLSPALQSRTRLFDQAGIKGQAGAVSICEVLWSQANVTSMMAAATLPSLVAPATAQLKLSSGDRDWALSGADGRSLSLGRAEGNDVIIAGAFTSRQHAKIEFRRGKFVLCDMSTNGTYVQTEDGQSVYLRREELPLWGSGLISLGEAIRADDPCLLHFHA